MDSAAISSSNPTAWDFEVEIIELDYKKRKFTMKGSDSLSVMQMIDLIIFYNSRLGLMNQRLMNRGAVN